MGGMQMCGQFDQNPHHAGGCPSGGLSGPIAHASHAMQSNWPSQPQSAPGSATFSSAPGSASFLPVGSATFPPGSGTFTPPSSGTFAPPGSGTYAPPGSGTFAPPGSGTFAPPGSGTYVPLGSGTFPPGAYAMSTPPSGPFQKEQFSDFARGPVLSAVDMFDPMR